MQTMRDTIVSSPETQHRYSEIIARRSAELEFVSAAYSTDEAWISTSILPQGCYDDDDVEQEDGRMNQATTTTTAMEASRVYRRLNLALSKHELTKQMMKSDSNSNSESESNSILPIATVELTLTMTDGYPLSKTSPLQIEASVISGAKQKIALDALPLLLRVCRNVAKERAEECEEAVFVVLSRAEEWMECEFREFVREHYWVEMGRFIESSHGHNHGEDGGGDDDGGGCCTPRPNRPVILGRRLIHSHHIIAKTKRKALADLSSHYNLGGYAKIGWPGVIVIEGAEQDCVEFVEEVRSMRWQHLVVRGEELDVIPDGCELDDARKLPREFVELGEDEMSRLASICRNAGLEDLFLTCMKMYRDKESGGESNVDVVQSNRGGIAADKKHGKSECNPPSYGVLVCVDHMNDSKGYRKWMQTTCKTVGCSLLLKQCVRNDSSVDDALSNKWPIILVGIRGDKAGVKQVLKRWRTSRVDVDSRGKPCLERMMTILVEGDIVPCLNDDQNDSDHQKDYNFRDYETLSNGSLISMENMKSLLHSAGGSSWRQAFISVL